MACDTIIDGLLLTSWRYNTKEFVITTRTMCEVITSWGVRNHGTIELSIGCVDRHQCTNSFNEEADLI